uniref:Uncharacterized protein n=1 Tax=Glossina brevipalpis TaxID=37001 RepID=A0A1A9X3E4_9MUSC
MNNENVVLGENAIQETSPTSTAATKEKKLSWFHSLTRRKKILSPTSSLANSSITSNSTAANETMNNNNEPSVRMSMSSVLDREDESNASSSKGRKRKEEKNVFQRFRKKMGLRFHSLRRRRRVDENDENNDAVVNGTIDASSEFLTHSPMHESLSFNFIRSNSHTANLLSEEPEMIPFTQDFKRFIVKKWLGHEDGPNRIMYKASSEMLSQVWYWGEISRQDAQKQLTDKPTGSFLVRDSESVGCQFTLSFRIINVTLHYRLEYRDDYWHFEELEYESIVEMIEDILYRCTNDNFVCFVKVPNEMQPPFPVILKYPLSRYLNMPKLQDLCRRVIQRTNTVEEMECLPLPPTLKEYLAEKRELLF